jgi:phosphoglycerate dehydrogenase-like enzyme
MIPEPLKMLISGDLAESLQGRIQSLFGTTAEFRIAPTPDAADLEWANSFTGFDLPNNLDTSQLQWVHCWGAGVEQWLDDRLSPGCLLSRTVGNMPLKIAEFCLAYSLGFLQGLSRVQHNQTMRTWKKVSCRYLHNQKVAVLGSGAIGSEICRLYQSCGAEVFGYNRTGSAGAATITEFRRTASQFDILVACLPDTDETHHLVNTELLGMCRLDHFINVGRGTTVNTDDLLDALAGGRIENAVLDVFTTEPLPEDSALWDIDRLLVSPHRSAPTETEDIVISLRELLSDGPDSRLVVDYQRQY